MRSIQVLALDIDGVVTDGTAISSNEGDMGKRFNFHDLDAVFKAKSCGLIIAMITGEDTPSVEWIARRFNVDYVKQGAKDKLEAITNTSIEMGIPLHMFCYVGDSDRDAPALRQVGLGLAPANATPLAKASAHRILSRTGGSGAVAEAVALLLQLKEEEHQASTMEKAMHAIVTDSLEAHKRLLDDSLSVLAKVAQTFIRAIRTGHKILFFGNGGSAADAQHVAGELVGRFSRESEPWPAIALTTDTSILTAIGNDWKYEEVFARQVRALARPGDVVVGISTIGRSPNVILGLQVGKSQGAVTVGFTGSFGGVLPNHAELCFRAPADSTPRIQELHLLAWHTICELVESELMSE